MIGFAGEERFCFQFGNIGIGGTEFLVQVLEEIVFLLDVGFFVSEVDVSFNITGDGREFFVGGNLVLGALAVTENPLGSFLIAPEIGVGCAGFERFQTLAVLRRVKDNSGRG